MSKHQQKLKLWVAIGFVTLFTAMSVIAYYKILKPIRNNREHRQGKYTMKQGYKTTFNPDYLDSLEQVKEAQKGKRK